MVAEFHIFSIQHVGMLFLLAAIATVLIRKGMHADDEHRVSLAIKIAGVVFSFEIIEALVLGVQGQYDYRTDLPLFLCDLSAVMLPFVVYRKNRKWIGILYFWSMAGTLQALITPDLEQGFPSFEFFRYFAMHGGIVIAILYIIIVFKIRIHWKDLVQAVLYAQVYLVCIHIINQVIQTNYGYTIQKPPGPTILDYFGAWPWYILWGEVLMLVLFLLLLLPFILFKPSTAVEEQQVFVND
jgi:hypothetical integral membrane protein (TIGR02206 family)